MRWLVRLLAPERGLILDPYVGSGTTGIAAMLEGRQFVGVERDPAFYTLACSRIDAARSNRP
jgi:DNA modification methylase